MPVHFKKRLLDKTAYEAASVFDVNNDGHPDVVSGAYWYEGPGFTQRHKICDVSPEGEYFDDFSDYPMDVNGDGYPDIITGGWWGETLRWRENPGSTREWKVHDIDRCGPIETIRYYDIDGCGIPEVFPNTPCDPQVFYKLKTDENGKGCGAFEKYVVSQGKSGHGMGFGDIDGDGRVDILLHNGWLQQPENLFTDPWIFHEEFELGSASVPILTCDITGNGLTDIIAGQAHNFGLAWWEQVIGSDGIRTWIKHDIDTAMSQYHDMQLVDIDGDGELELLTGKRYRAHCGNDPGETDDFPVGIYYFKIKDGRFEKHIIDDGPVGEATGCGIYFWVADLSGNGLPDIIAPGKDGLYLFENIGEEK